MFRPLAREPLSLCARFAARVFVRPRAIASLLACALSLAACDIPTALPKWNTTFLVQSENTTFSAAQLIPASVSITDNEFAMSVSPVSFSQDLAELCSSCAALAGQSGARPAFLGTFESSVGLPADVAAATLVGGQLKGTLSNGFSFDPLRSDGAMGKLTLTARSDGRVIGSRVVTGTTDALLPGGKLVVAVPVQGNVVEKMNVSVEINVPADDEFGDGSGQLDVTVSPSGLRATAARFSVQARHITARPMQLKLADIDKGIVSRTRSGAMVLSFTNPLGVSGTLTLRITGGARAVSKAVKVERGVSDVEVPFDATELRGFLGYNVTMSLAGSVSASENVTLTPEQILTVASRLKLTLGPKD